MKQTTLLVLALCAWPALSPAQSVRASPAAVADPAAAAPTLEYRSVLEHGPRGVVADSSDWKTANDEVGQFRRGHVDILKWEQAQESASRAPAMPATLRPPGPMPMHRH